MHKRSGSLIFTKYIGLSDLTIPKDFEEANDNQKNRKKRKYSELDIG